MTAALPETARVWIYQADRPFNPEETPAVRQKIKRFADEWVSHNRQLQAEAELYHDRFIVLIVDESHAGASGCSIDSSVRFLRGLEAEYGVDLFDRMTFAYQQGSDVKTAGREQFAELYASGAINDQTPVFDNLVNNLGDFRHQWVKPLGESWHKRMV
ncbi:MAG: hypothetical protein H6562_12915 [Lewinellaceae bacterium]|nr:hypothetical protein [Lewinella sp.]MCB9279795.1 hypothetical protein [Lewinellaceae bacterium]